MYLFTVPNMTCGGCAKSVTRALQSVDADAKIETDPPKREVRIQTSVREADLRAILFEAGYPVEDETEAA
ncbi:MULTISPECIES: heavy-metal-associated domain-containing protein [unclassified Ensifer]|uniref:heavy-metal-associated domain-containing protein n=1 Tax=unclassified Ensifer TaxID=2633371 RepID=UPI0008130CE7|nr:MULTISPECIES: heavy-metal-associated domain-containing protein [unclassified Ensifer]OCP19215.1 heavy metal transport/detoxification protein [Ensifer sp. LC54]OCP27373.1 heavy metal transport/detoxification protein [Ensifer sp. LC384]